jgi:SAM-dependent methyltransferase
MKSNTAEIIENISPAVDSVDLEQKVKNMYRDVAMNPQGDFHFEMGRIMAERLGYTSGYLDQIPTDAIDSFAGVGHHFDLANIQSGDRVVDLGSGSGMDTFIASLQAGDTGSVTGVDMTDEQLRKSQTLRNLNGFKNVSYVKAYIQSTRLEDGQFDVVISNGVINLAADKLEVFKEAARILKTGGRLAISDIVTKVQLPDNITCDINLWAACIGGALQQDAYINAILNAGFTIEVVRENPEYRFISKGAIWATETYGVKSISILARKT